MKLSKAKFLTQEEHDQLQKILWKYEKSNFRDATLIWMLIHTGARVSEILNIKVKDLYRSGMIVQIFGLKNSNDRELPLSPFLFNRMIVLSAGLGEEDRIFDFGYIRARQIWNEWRPVAKKIHSMRHYRAMDIYRKFKDVRLVQKVLGHKHLHTTMIYLEYEYSVQELQRALL